MLFSEKFNITTTNQDDWFDPILYIDTQLFIDPCLVFDAKDKIFKNAKERVVQYFQEIFEIAALSSRSKKDERHKLLLKNLLFPEAKEICLGYSKNKVEGAWSGRWFAKKILNAVYQSIDETIDCIDFFEGLWILNEWIDADRISDITYNILKQQFINYTKEVCLRHSIETKLYSIDRCFFKNGRWHTESHELPENPFNEWPIILVPKEFLRRLPVINSGAFGDYIYNLYGESIRSEFNIEVKKSLDKKTIVKIAKSKSKRVVDFIDGRKKNKKQSYNFINDPLGLINWYPQTKKYTAENPLSVKSFDESWLIDFIEKIVEKFKEYVEDNAAYKLLRDWLKHKPESATQLLFLWIVKGYCEIYDIDVSKEPNIGRWPVDFKFSNWAFCKVLLEVKNIDNTKFRNGLNEQLPQYIKSEWCTMWYFLVVGFSDKDFTKVEDIKNKVDDVFERIWQSIKYGVIDARPKPSASYL